MHRQTPQLPNSAAVASRKCTVLLLPEEASCAAVPEKLSGAAATKTSAASLWPRPHTLTCHFHVF